VEKVLYISSNIQTIKGNPGDADLRCPAGRPTCRWLINGIGQIQCC